MYFWVYAEKGIRYQLDVKANSVLFGLQIYEQGPVHTDTRTDQEYKYFSAFANTDSGVTFCLNSLTDNAIELQI